MIGASIWYAQQWDKFHSPYYGDYRDALDREDPHAAVVPFYVTATFAFPSVAIATSPYAYLFSKASQLSHRADLLDYELSSVKHFARHAPFSDIVPMRAAASRRLASKWFLARAGARLLPGLGWGLLAYDIYSVSKWYLESDF